MIDEFIEFIKEREKIRYRKESGLPKPWTDDPILAKYSFCNIRRDDDGVTRWLRKNWFEPNKEQEDLWFAAMVARNVNEPKTLSELDFPLPWQPENFLLKMAERQARGERLFRAAYMIRVGKTFGQTKSHGLVTQMFNPLWSNRAAIRPRWGDSLNEFHIRLVNSHGLGSFLDAQIVADIKPYGFISDAPDWVTFAAPGPGSIQGLNSLNKREIKAPWSSVDFQNKVNELREIVNKKLRLDPPLDAQNCQNCLCEWSKYYKAKYLGKAPRRRYA